MSRYQLNKGRPYGSREADALRHVFNGSIRKPIGAILVGEVDDDVDIPEVMSNVLNTINDIEDLLRQPSVRVRNMGEIGFPLHTEGPNRLSNMRKRLQNAVHVTCLLLHDIYVSGRPANNEEFTVLTGVPASLNILENYLITIQPTRAPVPNNK